MSMTRNTQQPCNCPEDRGEFTLLMGDDAIHYGHSFQNPPPDHHVISGVRPELLHEAGIFPVKSFYPGGAGSKSDWYHVITCEQYNRLLCKVKDPAFTSEEYERTSNEYKRMISR